MTRLIAPLCLIALAHPVISQEPSTQEMVVIDLRPQEEKDGNALTPLTGKCNDKVYRVGDVASDPLKVDQLKADLVERLGVLGDGKTLTVLNWSVYFNKQAYGHGPKNTSFGIQGYAIPGKKKEKQLGSKCARSETAGGWYQAGDVSSAASPLISEFQGTFAGKRMIVRVVHAPHREIEGKFQGAADDASALLELIHKTADVLAEAIVR